MTDFRQKILEHLATDPKWEFRRAAGKHVKSEQHIAKLATDLDSSVRGAVAANKHTKTSSSSTHL